jgi:pimeloyl-ACP methyl ester carboxylesterase
MLEVRANGLRFACLEEGQGPLVLLLHGFPDTPQTWDYTRSALARAGYRAVSPFMRGYVPSEIPQVPAYDSDTLGRDALCLIEALGEQSAFLVGHDWGASAAYSAAGLQPERLRMLITVSIPHPAALAPTPRTLWALRHFFKLRQNGICERLRADDLRYVDELLHRWSPEWRVPEGESAAVKRAFREPGCLEAAVGYYRALALRLPAAQRKPVTMPAVAFSGASDLLAPAAYERARSRYANRYEIVKMPGGHFMHREHPEHFTRELVRVLDAERARSRA